jgi:hypothetical protein
MSKLNDKNTITFPIWQVWTWAIIVLAISVTAVKERMHVNHLIGKIEVGKVLERQQHKKIPNVK